MAYSTKAFKQIAKPMPKPKTDNKKTGIQFYPGTFTRLQDVVTNPVTEDETTTVDEAVCNNI
jgi:hypothetical protein